MSEETRFTVLEGGLANPDSHSDDRVFVSAWVTDTRLMGVVCMYVHWRTGAKADVSNLHQFFYFDAEELGFDRYEYDRDGDKIKLEEIESSFIGGLGGNKVAINMNEALCLLKKYMKFNEDNDIPLPDGKSTYIFMTTMDSTPTLADESRLLSKCCIRPRNKTELANYFIMRYAAADREALSVLSKEKMELPEFHSLSPCTLYKNDVTFEKSHNLCRCESLIGNDDTYALLVSELAFDGMKVSGYRKISDMKISSAEVYLNLTHPEYVTVYKYSGEPSDFNRSSTILTGNAMIINEHGGTTFIMFHPDNEHVAKSNYRLYEDLLGVYHVTRGGQLLASANNLASIRKLELDLALSGMAGNLEIEGSYEFNEPVLMQFLDSDFSSFTEFIEAIKLD